MLLCLIMYSVQPDKFVSFSGIAIQFQVDKAVVSVYIQVQWIFLVHECTATLKMFLVLFCNYILRTESQIHNFKLL